jgi:hypothetical protein
MFMAILRTSLKAIGFDDEEGVELHHQGTILARPVATIAATMHRFGSVDIESRDGS